MTEVHQSDKDPPTQSFPIPIAQTRELGEFIANLLGQRRRLSRQFDVCFVMDWPWVYNLDQLVVQRVEHQNEANLVDFSFKMFLENGRTTEITSRPDFLAFRDLSNSETVGAEILWTFIVKFPTSQVPEKQEIRFVARTKDLDTTNHSKRRLERFLFPNSEQMNLDIFYTNVTWGEDLMVVVSNHILSAFKTRFRFISKLVRILLLLISPILTLVVLISTSYFLSRDITDRVNGLRSDLAKLNPKAPITIDTLNTKLDMLLRWSAKEINLLPGIPTMVLFALGIIAIMGAFAALPLVIPRSFIVLNDISAKRHKEYVQFRYLILVLICLSFAVGTAASILADKITSFVFG